MVNTIRNFPRGAKPNPLSGLTDAQRKIATPDNRSLYNLDAVKKLLQSDPSKIILATDRPDGSATYAQKAGLKSIDIAFIFSLLTPTDYIDSEWCYTSARMAIDCDSYAIRLEYNGKEKELSAKHVRTRSITDGIEYFVKFGSPNEKNIMIVSLHPSKYR